jgi:hypothetical protein
MSDLTTAQILTMPVGAKAGQIILLVELSMTPQPDRTIEILESKGYSPKFYSCAFKTGQRLVAVLKDEQFDPCQEIDDEYLMDEWMDLGAIINRDAVRLWRGHPAKNDQATPAVSA